MTKAAKDVRWTVVVTLDDGTIITHYIEEIEELDEIIELGPHWAKIKNIVITYNFKEGRP